MRHILALISILSLAACAGAATVTPTAPDRRVETRVSSAKEAAFQSWVRAYKARAVARGIPEPVLERAFADVRYNAEVIDKDRNQAEFSLPIWDYLARLVSDDQVSNGQRALRRHRRVLDRIEARYGVEKEVVAAVWGAETRYGETRGTIPVIEALATLAFDGRRGAFFEQQLIAALKILERGDITVGNMRGSWAGAMGHTQFIPTSYQAFAVDFDGDGRRDIWSNDPTDALASAANYLKRNGWTTGRPWGAEVILPANYSGPFGRSARQSASALSAAGLRRADGRAMSSLGSAGILIPAGRSGPAFAVTSNFGVLLRYNNAENYALGLGHLSDRITGGGPLVGQFGPDQYGLTLADRKALQAGLKRAGFDAGTPDGVLGNKTATALRAYQRANGLAVTGTPTRDILNALR